MIDLVASFIFTWIIGLLPAYLIRYVFIKHPLKKRYAIPLVFIFWTTHFIISAVIKDLAGVNSSPSPVLGLVALISYLILTRKLKNETKK